MIKATCPECGGTMVSDGTGTTLVGYFSPEGHDHDDNCRTRFYQCNCGHEVVVSKRNRCSACDWKGKDECFCHKGVKVDNWPVLITINGK